MVRFWYQTGIVPGIGTVIPKRGRLSASELSSYLTKDCPNGKDETLIQMIQTEAMLLLSKKAEPHF